jgi:hypothetical protein
MKYYSMVDLKKVYFAGILVITIIVLFLYIKKEREHHKELDKIRRLEKQIKKEKYRLTNIRKQTKPCPVRGFTDPRNCYVQSNYRCSWNEQADRCDRK